MLIYHGVLTAMIEIIDTEILQYDEAHLCSSGKHVRAMNTPLNPTLFYSKTGVCRGIPISLSFAPKHRLWVLVRTVLTCTHNLCFEQK